MLKNLKFLKISMTAFAIAIAAFFVVSCDKQDEVKTETPEITQEMITPQAIVCGDVDVASLSKEQRVEFLINYFYIEDEALKEIEASHLILNEMSTDEIFKGLNETIKERPNESLSEEAKWFFVHTLKEQINLKFGKIDLDLDENNPDDRAQKLYERARKKTGESLVLPTSSLKSSTNQDCPEYEFNLFAKETSTYNRNCYAVVPADNYVAWYEPCDFMACFMGYGTELCTTSAVIDGLITDAPLAGGASGGFGGYGSIVLRKSYNRTYVLLGSIKTTQRFAINGIFSPESYIKSHLKLKV